VAVTIHVEGTLEEVWSVLSAFGSHGLDSSEQILDELGSIEEREKQMADILDTILANEGAESDELDQVAKMVSGLNSDLQALKAGSIPVGDPRLAQLADKQAKMNTVFMSLLKSQATDTPPASTPPDQASGTEPSPAPDTTATP
jgi:hypothetical protein